MAMHKPRRTREVHAAEGQAVGKRFRVLATGWQAATGGLSSPSRKRADQNYLDIIGMGSPAIPFILAELRDHGGYWYPALRALTGDDPVPADHRGTTQLMNEDWLHWGRSHGYAV
jgi:hypothetical protein